MKFSVVIPCHNAGPWIQRTLRSVAEQSHPPHEVILVDDASTDDSAEKIRASGVDVTLIHVNHRNAAAARNAGIEEATGDWIAFLDSQDIWYSHHLARARQLLGKSGDVAFMAAVDLLEGDGKVTPTRKVEPIREAHHGLTSAQYMRLCARGLGFRNITAVMLRDRVLEVGGFDTAMTRRHDLDLWLRVIHGRTCAYDPTPTAAARLDVSHGLSQNRVVCTQYRLKALLKNRDRYRLPAMDAVIRRAARETVAAAFADGGDPEARRAAIRLGWPHMSWRMKLLTGMGVAWPAAFSGAIGMWRKRASLPRLQW